MRNIDLIDFKNHPNKRLYVGTGATGAKAPVNFEQWVPGTRPETKCAYHKFSNEGEKFLISNLMILSF